MPATGYTSVLERRSIRVRQFPLRSCDPNCQLAAPVPLVLVAGRRRLGDSILLVRRAFVVTDAVPPQVTPDLPGQACSIMGRHPDLGHFDPHIWRDCAAGGLHGSPEAEHRIQLVL
jgi:hypothetical protein